MHGLRSRATDINPVFACSLGNERVLSFLSLTAQIKKPELLPRFFTIVLTAIHLRSCFRHNAEQLANYQYYNISLK